MAFWNVLKRMQHLEGVSEHSVLNSIVLASQQLHVQVIGRGMLNPLCMTISLDTTWEGTIMDPNCFEPSRCAAAID